MKKKFRKNDVVTVREDSSFGFIMIGIVSFVSKDKMMVSVEFEGNYFHFINRQVNQLTFIGTL